MWIGSSRACEARGRRWAAALVVCLGAGPASAEPWAVLAPAPGEGLSAEDAAALGEGVREALGFALQMSGDTLLTPEVMDILAPPELRGSCEIGPCLGEQALQLQAAVVVGIHVFTREGAALAQASAWAPGGEAPLGEWSAPLTPGGAMEAGRRLGAAVMLDLLPPPEPVPVPVAEPVAPAEVVAEAPAQPPPEAPEEVPAAELPQEGGAPEVGRRPWGLLAGGAVALAAGGMLGAGARASYEAYRAVPAGSEQGAFDDPWGRARGLAGAAVAGGGLGVGLTVAFGLRWGGGP